MHIQPMIAVADVAASSRWYQQLLGCRSGHGGDEYEQLVDARGVLLLQLHHWDTHEHPHLGDPALRPLGNGVLLWFQVDDFDAALARAKQMPAQVLEGPHVNPRAQHRELWLADPDGYRVVLASAYGEV
jgi:catechol 2,3-dioxygenase-like lactoylglutathione lyase family enzyme